MKVENTAEKLFFKLIKDYLTAVEDMFLPGAVHSRLTHTHTPSPSASNVAETSTRETKHQARRAGELRCITPAGPEELTL